MIKERDVTIGYHCPYCGLSIVNTVNIFLMADNLIKFKCVCGASELSVQALKNNKYKLTTPCILCPNPHSFTLSSSAFFNKELFPFSCKFTDVIICFLGKSTKVYDALRKNEEELIKLFAAFEEEYAGEGEPPADYGGGFLWGYDPDDPGGPDEFDEDGDEFYGGEPEFVLHKNTDYIPGDTGGPVNTEHKKNPEDIIKNIKLPSYQIVGQILENISKLKNAKKIFCGCGAVTFGDILVLPGAVRIKCKVCGAYRDIKAAGVSDAEYLNEIKELYLDFED